MVDDLGCEYSDTVFICKLLCIRHNFDVKSQKACIFFLGNDFGLGQVLHSLEDVLFVNRSNVHGADWDLRLVQELKKSLKRTNGRSLDAYTILSFVNVLLEDID